MTADRDTSVMKIVRDICLICMAVLSLNSCGSYKRGKTPPPPKYSNQTIDRLSKQFGLHLTQNDNIALYEACSGWIGVKYRYGGNSKAGVDCSGLAHIIYRQVYGRTIQRNSANILQKDCTPVTRSNLREGDFVFFNTSGSARSRTPSHVGIYLKSGKFIHASSSRGVVVNNLSEAYYVRTWLTGGRIKK